MGNHKGVAMLAAMAAMLHDKSRFVDPSGSTRTLPSRATTSLAEHSAKNTNRAKVKAARAQNRQRKSGKA